MRLSGPAEAAFILRPSHSQVDLSTSLLSGAAALGISANRRLSRHSVGVVSASVTPWGEAWLANLSFKVAYVARLTA